MSDLERFIELYNSVGLEINPESHDGKLIVFLEANGQEESGEKLIGYSGFHSILTFDKDGKFLNQGFWE